MNEVRVIKKIYISKLALVFLISGLILLVSGVSYAFFGYYKSGLYTHSFNGGKMNVIYNETTGNNVVSSMFGYSGMHPGSNNKSLKTIIFDNVNTSTITNMSYMFCGLTSIEALDLSDFNTSNVTDMSGMFSGCINLVSLDLSNFDTDQVTNMSGMFFCCTGLTTLDLSGFVVLSSTNIGTAYGDGIFAGCSSLQSLDISGFDLSNISLYAYTFRAMSDNVTIYVKDTASQSRILSMSNQYRPANWSISNIIVKA